VIPLVPYERVCLRSEAPADEILRRLARRVEPTKWLRNPLSHAHLPYEGRIDRNQFKISRIIHHRNSFLPTIIGSVRVDGTGAVIDATLRPHFNVIVFMALWCGFLAVATAEIIARQLSNGVFQASGLIPPGMVLFGYFMMRWSFFAESKKAKRFLEDLALSPSF